MKFFLALIFTISTSILIAQKDDTLSISFSGFVDSYVNFTNPDNFNKNNDALFNHTNSNEFSLNIAMLKTQIRAGRLKANIAFITGTYVDRNMAAEPNFYKNIWEANLEFNINSKWKFQAGIFTSHIGFETALSSENLMLSRSLLAENSPYYLNGINLIYTPNKKWKFLFNINNGWQEMKDQNEEIAFGSQVQYTPNNNWTVNLSSYLGNDIYNNSKGLREFHNTYVKYKFTKSKIELVASVDVGKQFTRRYTTKPWLAMAGVVSVPLSEKLNIAGRIERFQDEFAVILADESTINAGSIGLCYKLNKVFQARIEGKIMDRDYVLLGTNRSNNVLISFAASF